MTIEKRAKRIVDEIEEKVNLRRYIETELRAAIEQEREECAKACDSFVGTYGSEGFAVMQAAAEIRKRKNQVDIISAIESNRDHRNQVIDAPR
jgi:hypothetical protein